MRDIREILSYLETLDYLAKNKINDTSRNCGEINRKKTILNIIKHSYEQIKIYETESNIIHYSEEIEELYDFIWEREGNLTILLDSLKEESLFSNFIKDNYYTKKIELKLTNKKFLNKDNLEGHFILGDKSRFALSFYPNKESEIITLFNFNGKKFSKHLNQFFEGTFNNLNYSEPLKLSEKIV